MALPYIESDIIRIVSKPGGGAYVAFNAPLSSRVSTTHPGGTIRLNSGLIEVDASGAYVQHWLGQSGNGSDALNVDRDGNIIFGRGPFAPFLYRLNPDFTDAALPLTGLAPDSDVKASVPLPDGSLLLGGSFTTIGGVTSHGITKIQAGSDTVDPAFHAPQSGSTTVNALAVDSQGRIIVGGTFYDNWDGANRRYLCRLNPDGTLDGTFNPPKPSKIVWDLAVDDQDRIYVSRGDASNSTDGELYRILPNGNVDTSFTNSGLSRSHETMFLSDGTFLHATRSDLRRYSANGALLNTYGSRVTTFAHLGGGQYLAGRSWDNASLQVLNVGIEPVSTDPPDAPVLDSVTTGDGSATLSFTPATSGAAADSFVGSATPSAGGAVITGTSTGSPVVITGLTNGTEYLFSVEAVNGNGPSDPSNVITGTPSTVPSQVTDVTLVDITSTDFTIEWTAPNDGGSPITDYVLEYRLLAAPTYDVYADGLDPEPTGVIGELEPATEYEIRVAAVNVNGTGPFSLPVSATTTVGIPAPIPGQGLKARLAQIAGVAGAEMVEAANVWAGTTGETLVTAINVKAGTVGESLKTALNVLAGTVGEEAVVAARKIGGYE